jgi:hypothetical protein
MGEKMNTEIQKPNPSPKTFVQSIDNDQFGILLDLAVKRNMTVQKFIKNIVIPEWLRVVRGKDVERP